MLVNARTAFLRRHVGLAECSFDAAMLSAFNFYLTCINEAFELSQSGVEELGELNLAYLQAKSNK